MSCQRLVIVAEPTIALQQLLVAARNKAEHSRMHAEMLA